MSAEPAGTARPGCALAFDFGLRRIGVALALPGVNLASVLGVIPARDGEPDWSRLDQLVREWAPQDLIVGLPCAADGSPGPGTVPAQAFAGRLAQRYALPVSFVDERLTSHAAEDILREERRSGVRKHRVRSGDVDSVAARLIAETWLSQS